MQKETITKRIESAVTNLIGANSANDYYSCKLCLESAEREFYRATKGLDGWGVTIFQVGFLIGSA